jgi:hypothetical protein
VLSQFGEEGAPGYQEQAGVLALVAVGLAEGVEEALALGPGDRRIPSAGVETTPATRRSAL